MLQCGHAPQTCFISSAFLVVKVNRVQNNLFSSLLLNRRNLG